MSSQMGATDRDGKMNSSMPFHDPSLPPPGSLAHSPAMLTLARSLECSLSQRTVGAARPLRASTQYHRTTHTPEHRDGAHRPLLPLVPCPTPRNPTRRRNAPQRARATRHSGTSPHAHRVTIAGLHARVTPHEPRISVTHLQVDGGALRVELVVGILQNGRPHKRHLSGV